MIGTKRRHRLFVVAPAGHGKTEEISKIVSQYRGSKKILILTHTNAGVLSLRKRIGQKTKNKFYEIFTIDSFIIKYAMRYPSLSFVSSFPKKNDEYRKCRNGVFDVVKTEYFQNILKENYAQIIVDEYQDCSVEQHRIMVCISENVPCLIFGDPMQGIFSFRGNELVDWNRDIYSIFNIHPEIKLEIPHRWNTQGVPELGRRIYSIRIDLENDKRELKSGGVIQIFIESNKFEKYKEIVWSEINKKNSLLVLLDSANINIKRKFALPFKGNLQVIDSIDSHLFSDFLLDVENEEGFGLCEVIRKFVKECFSSTDADFSSICGARGAIGSCTIRRRDRCEQNRVMNLCGIMKEVVNNKGVKRINTLLMLFHAMEKDYILFRKDIWISAKRAMEYFLKNYSMVTLEDSGRIIRRELSFFGRNFRRIIGTTLLTKGLEYDTVIIVDSKNFKNKDMYVAISRAKKQVYIINGK